jgi:hypothetical protein
VTPVGRSDSTVLRLGRRGRAIELNHSYFLDGANYLQAQERQRACHAHPVRLHRRRGRDMTTLLWTCGPSLTNLTPVPLENLV